jgi:2'-5' RNA ligase
MQRLFIAIDLPDAVIAELKRIWLPTGDDVRAVRNDQLHLTLHFLGDAEVDRVAEALKNVSVPSFKFSIVGTGYFVGRGASFVLWAGVSNYAKLQSLYSAIADALLTHGFNTEDRPYSPHITLARCQNLARRKKGVSWTDVEKFITRSANLRIADIPITRFGLYSSTPSNQGPIYRCEREFLLH